MEHQRILSLLKKAGDFKFGIKKWNTVNDQLNVKYGAGKQEMKLSITQEH